MLKNIFYIYDSLLRGNSAAKTAALKNRFNFKTLPGRFANDHSTLLILICKRKKQTNKKRTMTVLAGDVNGWNNPGLQSGNRAEYILFPYAGFVATRLQHHEVQGFIGECNPDHPYVDRFYDRLISRSASGDVPAIWVHPKSGVIVRNPDPEDLHVIDGITKGLADRTPVRRVADDRHIDLRQTFRREEQPQDSDTARFPSVLQDFRASVTGSRKVSGPRAAAAEPAEIIDLRERFQATVQPPQAPAPVAVRYVLQDMRLAA